MLLGSSRFFFLFTIPFFYGQKVNAFQLGLFRNYVADKRRLGMKVDKVRDGDNRSIYVEWCQSNSKDPGDEEKFQIFCNNLMKMEKYMQEEGIEELKLNEYADLTEEEYAAIISSTPQPNDIDKTPKDKIEEGMNIVIEEETKTKIEEETVVAEVTEGTKILYEKESKSEIDMVVDERESDIKNNKKTGDKVVFAYSKASVLLEWCQSDSKEPNDDERLQMFSNNLPKMEESMKKAGDEIKFSLIEYSDLTEEEYVALMPIANIEKKTKVGIEEETKVVSKETKDGIEEEKQVVIEEETKAIVEDKDKFVSVDKQDKNEEKPVSVIDVIGAIFNLFSQVGRTIPKKTNTSIPPTKKEIMNLTKPPVKSKKNEASFFDLSKPKPRKVKQSPQKSAPSSAPSFFNFGAKSNPKKKQYPPTQSSSTVSLFGTKSKKKVVPMSTSAKKAPNLNSSTTSLFRKSSIKEATLISASAKKVPNRGTISLTSPTNKRSFSRTMPIKKSNSVTRSLKTPTAIPLISNFVQNKDGSITGKVYNSIAFRNGAKIVTSPVKRGAKAGMIVTTRSGSKYKLK